MYYASLQQCCVMTWFMIFFYDLAPWNSFFFFSPTHETKAQLRLIFRLNCWIIDAEHDVEITDWSRRASDPDKPIQTRMCYTLCACNINGGEVYLLPSRAAASALIGAVCSRLLHFHCSLPSLVPTHLHLRSHSVDLALLWLLSPLPRLHLSPLEDIPCVITCPLWSCLDLPQEYRAL